MFDPPEWDQAANIIQNATSILVVTHINPDGDAIGSALGLTNALKQMGKKVSVADDDGVPEYLRFLPGSESCVTELDSGSWDVMISADASDEVRTGQTGEYGRKHADIVINLDHHITNTQFGDIHLVVPTAVSTTEIVHDLLMHMGIVFDLDIAVPLLTGLVTDTLGFRTNNVTPRTLEVAQSLMNYGASLAEVTARTLQSQSWHEVSVWKRVLPSAELSGEVISAIIRRSDVTDVGLDDIDTSGLVSFLVQVNEARVAVIFKEEDDNLIKISLRSKPGYDVASVAFELGGGGHRQASGATIAGTLDEVQARVGPLLQRAVAEGSLEIG